MKTLKQQPIAFHALHAIYHERDFIVRVNSPTIQMVKRILGEIVNEEVTTHECPACAAGYDPVQVYR